MSSKEISLHLSCEEIFEDYIITDFKLDGDDVVLKIKKKNNLNDIFKIINSLFDACNDINNRFPAEI